MQLRDARSSADGCTGRALPAAVRDAPVVGDGADAAPVRRDDEGDAGGDEADRQMTRSMLSRESATARTGLLAAGLLAGAATASGSRGRIRTASVARRGGRIGRRRRPRGPGQPGGLVHTVPAHETPQSRRPASPFRPYRNQRSWPHLDADLERFRAPGRVARWRASILRASPAMPRGRQPDQRGDRPWGRRLGRREDRKESSCVGTIRPKPGEIERRWHVIDANDVVLGRLASQAATLLRGKHKPQFAPHVDTGDFVVIVNADEGRGRPAPSSASSATATPATRAACRSGPSASCSSTDPSGSSSSPSRACCPKNTLGRAQLQEAQGLRRPRAPARRAEARSRSRSPRSRSNRPAAP